jgi:hypothetical protein
LRLEPENLREPEAKKTQAAGVKEVPPAQAITELDGAISV